MQADSTVETNTLEVAGLRKCYGATVALDGVSLRVPAGQMVAILGRSGAGKSTLLRLLNRLLDPDGGRITFAGRGVAGLKGRALRAWRAECAMIFQHFNLSPRLDVLTNVLIGQINAIPPYRSAFKFFHEDERLKAAAALDRLGLADKALLRAENLSGGQQQRVAIARALMQAPRLLLADEPVASLDPHNARIVMDALRTINREHGIAVLCNLHNIDLARAYGDRIVALEAGRVVFDGPPAGFTEATARAVFGESSPEAGIDEEAAPVRMPA